MRAITGEARAEMLEILFGGALELRVWAGPPVIPSGAFNQPALFTITRQDGSAPAPGADAGGQPAVVQPVAAYAFSFAVPALNSDAQLSFTVGLAQLDDATRAALPAGAQEGTATIAVKSDAAGSSYQAFARCGSGQSPATDGCVTVSLLDAGGEVVTDPADAASVQFDGVAGHFSSYAVAIVAPAGSTPPEINGSGSGGGVVGGAPGQSGPVTDHTPPVLSKLSARPSVVRLASAHHKACSAALRFTLSESSLVTFTAELVLPGRRSGKRCVAGRRTQARQGVHGAQEDRWQPALRRQARSKRRHVFGPVRHAHAQARPLPPHRHRDRRSRRPLKPGTGDDHRPVKPYGLSRLAQRGASVMDLGDGEPVRR